MDFPGYGDWRRIGIPDPAKVNGSEEEILAAFRAVRDDDMLQKISNLMNN